MSQEMRVISLRCEYLENPLGMDETRPRFSYLLECDRRGARQVRRRIQVASTNERFESGSADLWDSGWVDDGVTAQITYSGKALRSRQPCYWQVEVEDELGERSVSEIACWTMGLLQAADWRAGWIAADPEVIRRDADAIIPGPRDCGTPTLFRKELALEAAPVRATLYLTARGLVEAEINSERVGDDLFAPEWTDYDTRIHYRTYDVTDRLKGRETAAIGLTLGDGWWSGFVGWQETRGRYGDLQNSVMAQLELEFADGRRETVVTDSSWRCEAGPILYSDFMMGERYDARRERRGWSSPGFDDSRWLAAVTVAQPRAILCAQHSEPVRIVEMIEPVSCSEVEPGVFIYDVGQNVSGWARIRVTEAAGTEIRIRFAERLNPDGMLYTENLRRAKATDFYVCKGDGEEKWQPRFTFHGFQYVEVTGVSSAGARDCVSACVIQSATPPAGHFECGNADVNRLWLNGLWSQKDNFLSVPTDCPQRDERLGWMGDAQVFLRTATYNMDVAAFFSKWMVDVTDAQTEEGIFPDVAPRLREDESFVGLDDLVGGAAWADAGVIIPHTIWKVYGDTRIVERHWNAMTAWLDYLERINPDYLRVNELRNNYGDWLCIPSDREFRVHSPMKNLLATAYWANDAAKMAEMARALGKSEEAERFQGMFEKVRSAFQAEFVKEDGSLTVETQTAYLLALAMDLMPQSLREAAALRLVENIRQLDWHLSTGFVGIRFLNPVLTEAGYPEVAYRLLLQDSYPSWLYPVRHGATTIWERWNGWTEEGGFFDPQMNSFNHYSLGSVGEWLFSHVAGIDLLGGSPGFEKAKLKPYPSAELGYASASYRSLHGVYFSEWRFGETNWTWTIVIPANACAELWIPTADRGKVRVDGAALDPGVGLEVLEVRDDWIRCRAVAGRYVVTVAAAALRAGRKVLS